MDVSDVAEAEQESQNCASGTETTSNNIISYEYQIPEWFPKGNIKTPKDLDGLESRIHISNIDCDDQCLKHEDSSVYEIPYDLFSELSDITFAAFVRNADGNLPSELPGVLIRTSSTKYIEPIDGIVVQFAKDLGATLVSIDLEDLEDLGREFIRQDDNHSQPTQCEEDDAESPPEAPNLQSMTGLTEHYFVVKSEQHASKSAWLRVDRAISAIINAARVKNRACVSATPSDNETSQSSPIVLHLRNLNRILQIDYRYRFLARLRDFVQERRKAGESLIFLATMLTTVDPFYDEDYSTEPRIIAKMGISEGSSVTINPTPREGQEPSATERDSYVAMINTRRLKRLLRNRLLKGASISFLDPNSGWGNLDSSLDGSLWAESELKRAITHIAGRTYKKPALNLDDVEIVLRRLNLCKEPQPEITEVVQDDNVDETDGLTAWEEKIAGIRDDCNDFEKELLECVVNRENLESTYDDVIIDSESKETMKHLVSMSNSCPEAKSDFLLSQIRINGALLYGPPGTGKTHLSHAVAKESGMNMIAIDSASVISKYVGDSDKYIKAAFTLASKLFPCILFLDEVDCLFYRRSSDDKTWERSALTQFLQCLDGLVKDEKRPFVIAATNRPSDIDDAFLRRLPQKLLFELPDAVSRLKILRIFLKDEDLHSSLDVEGLANVTEGYSGSDLRNLCGEAAIIWTIEQGRGEAGDPPEEKAKLCLEARHFGKALRRIRPSVSKTALTEFANFTQQYNSNNLKSSTSVSDIIDELCFTKFDAISDEATLASTPISRSTTEVEPDVSFSQPSITKIEDLTYEHLVDDGFRLLVIEPGSMYSTLKAELIHATLTDPPNYHALSYTWGPPDPAFYMNCGGTATRITKNLRDALFQLRQEDRSITVWVDAVCINQKDDEEKSKQVARMREIYSKAEFLFIWIGDTPNPHDADLAFDTMGILEEIFLRHADANDLRLPWPQENGVKYAQWGKEISKEIKKSPIQARHWKALRQFYLAPWFSRVWIYQEAVSFPGNPESNMSMAFGTRRISWDLFAKVTGGLSIFSEVLHKFQRKAFRKWERFPWLILRAIQIERNTHMVTIPLDGNVVSREEVTALLKAGRGAKLCTSVHIESYPTRSPNSMREVVDNVIQSATELNLPSVKCTIKHISENFHTTGGVNSRLFHHLFLSRQMLSTDPRDKIFAFYGVLQNELRTDPLLVPDYTKSIIDVFIDVTLYFIQRESCFDIFELLYDQPSQDTTITGLPSWANDWTQPATLEKFHTTKFSAGGGNYLGMNLHTSKIKLSEDRRKLGLQVYVAGKVCFHVPPENEYTYEYISSMTNSSEWDFIHNQTNLSQAERGGYLDPVLEYFRYSDCLVRAKWAESKSFPTIRTRESLSPPSKEINYPTGESLYEAFWRTMVCNLNLEGNAAEDWVEDAFEIYHDILVGYSDCQDTSVNSKAVDDMFQKFQIEHNRYTISRRFCVTDSSLMGWMPRRAAAGDLICVIPGARIPYVIRESGGDYEIIGHAYIHGLTEDIVENGEVRLTEKGKTILGAEAFPVDIWLK